MPAFLPFLGGIAQAFGGRAVSGIMGTRLASSFVARQQVNIPALARQLGTPTPSQSQIHAAQLQQARQQFVQSATKMAHTMGSLAALGPAAYGATRALEGFGALLLHRRRALEPFHSGIASTFRQIERQDILLGAQTARGAAPSTIALGRAFMDLREDMQPLNEVITRTTNLMGLLGLKLAGLVTEYVFKPVGKQAVKLLNSIEKRFGLDAFGRSGPQAELTHHFRQMSRGNFGRPVNRGPNERDD